MRLAYAACALLVLLGTACGPAAGRTTPSATKPPASPTAEPTTEQTAEAIALRLSDLPPGFERESAERRSAPGVPAYSVSFRRGGKASTEVRGLAQVVCATVVAPSSLGAQAAIDQIHLPANARSTALDEPLGDRSSAFAWELHAGTLVFQAYAVKFRKLNAGGMVMVVGTGGDVALSDATSLVKTILERITAD